jgi:hypothetical protein
MSLTLRHQDKMSISSSYSVAPRHRNVEFGDGYIQRTPLGLQHKRRSLSVVHTNLDPQRADEVISDYENAMYTGDHMILYANGLLREDGQFYLQSFNVEMTSPEIRSVSASLIEVYDL